MDIIFEENQPDPKGVKKCKNCRHFCAYVYEYDDNGTDHMISDFGECRRFPPKIVPAEDSGFPVVEDTSWCGEFDF